MTKKYTMEELRKIYDDAERKTMEELSKSFKESLNDEDDNMQELVFGLQNVVVLATLRKYLFKGDEK